MRTIGMSDYTVGEDCFDELPGALDEYGAAKVAIIGGKRALAAALPSIEAALEGTDILIQRDKEVQMAARRVRQRPRRLRSVGLPYSFVNNRRAVPRHPVGCQR